MPKIVRFGEDVSKIKAQMCSGLAFLDQADGLFTHNLYSNGKRTILSHTSSASAEITRVGGHYFVQDDSKSLILIQIESPCTTSYQ